jgi:lipoprotein
MKKGLLLMVLILGMLLVGCGKEKETTVETLTVTENVNQNFTPDEFIKELLTNEKYFKKINGIEYFYPQYKELVCETFANREKPKNQMISFCYETEEELKELKEYAIKFNETHERMKLDIENAMEEKHNKTISFGNYFPETLK